MNRNDQNAGTRELSKETMQATRGGLVVLPDPSDPKKTIIFGGTGPYDPRPFEPKF